MVVEVNATIIVQIIHFLCAYVILRIFLLKPIVAHIDRQQREQDCLQEELGRQQQVVEQKEFEIKRLWQDAKHSFTIHSPVLSYISPVERKVSRDFRDVEPRISECMVNELAEEIIRKVDQ
jgi:hypothetical protein